MNAPAGQPDDDLSAPPGLARDLENLYAPGRSVPPEIDRRMAAAARARLARRRPKMIWWAASAAAVAAGLAAVFWVLAPAARDQAPAAPAQAAVSARAGSIRDVNGDGCIDILDAFLVARRIDAGSAADPRCDVNSDGAVDRRDVTEIAMAAVRISERAAQ